MFSDGEVQRRRLMAIQKINVEKYSANYVHYLVYLYPNVLETLSYSTIYHPIESHVGRYEETARNNVADKVEGSGYKAHFD